VTSFNSRIQEPHPSLYPYVHVYPSPSAPFVSLFSEDFVPLCFDLPDPSLSSPQTCVISLLVSQLASLLFRYPLFTVDESLRAHLRITDCFRIVWQPSLLTPLYSTLSPSSCCFRPPLTQDFLRSPSTHLVRSLSPRDFSHYTFSRTFSILNV
jgi:hypothetical protein